MATSDRSKQQSSSTNSQEKQQGDGRDEIARGPSARVRPEDAQRTAGTNGASNSAQPDARDDDGAPTG